MPSDETLFRARSPITESTQSVKRRGRFENSLDLRGLDKRSSFSSGDLFQGLALNIMRAERLLIAFLWSSHSASGRPLLEQPLQRTQEIPSHRPSSTHQGSWTSSDTHPRLRAKAHKSHDRVIASSQPNSGLPDHPSASQQLTRFEGSVGRFPQSKNPDASNTRSGISAKALLVANKTLDAEPPAMYPPQSGSPGDLPPLKLIAIFIAPTLVFILLVIACWTLYQKGILTGCCYFGRRRKRTYSHARSNLLQEQMKTSRSSSSFKMMAFRPPAPSKEYQSKSQNELSALQLGSFTLPPNSITIGSEAAAPSTALKALPGFDRILEEDEDTMLNHTVEQKESTDDGPSIPEYSEWLEPGTEATVSLSQAPSLPRTETQMKRQAIDGYTKAQEAVGNATEMPVEDVHQKAAARPFLPPIQTRFPTLSPPALGSAQTTKTSVGPPNELTTPQQPLSAFGTYQITHILDPVAAKHAVSHDLHPTKNTPRSHRHPPRKSKGTSKRSGQKAVDFEKESSRTPVSSRSGEPGASGQGSNWRIGSKSSDIHLNSGGTTQQPGSFEKTRSWWGRKSGPSSGGKDTSTGFYDSFHVW